jgi:asparagine synthase (glutamine-hydrolysing)
MCGIAGIIDGGDRETLERMAEVQAHRGPDDWGVRWFEERRSGLAHRRLSIIDLSDAGHQPMANATGGRWITFNGEIYNYRELRAELADRGHRFASHTDTEVILAAYDEWGAACVNRFNGMFAFAIYDEEAHELFIARDHLGIKPLYYAQRGPLFAFASEAKALFEIDGIDRSINFDAVASSLLLLWVPEPESGFDGVMKLEPGHYAFFRGGARGGELSITQYWDPPVHDPALRERSEEEYVEELREILERAIRRQMIADVPVGAFLSGGLDSSLIVALMRKVHGGAISTYTIAFSERDKQLEAMPDDARYAAIVARHFATDHHEILARPDSDSLLPMMLHHLDDPVADGASINTYLIASAARERGTVVLLNGMGGDEVFGGYRKHLASLMVERYRAIPRAARAIAEPLIRSLPVSVGSRGIRPVRWAKRFLRSVELSPLDSFIYGFAYFNPDEMRRLLRAPYNAIPFERLYPIERYRSLAATVADLGLVDRMTYLDTKLFLPGLNLLYSDKASMAASVESRPPLIDVELVEFASRLPARYKINGRVQKYLLKRAAEAYLPKEIIYRPKAAFGTPIRAWMARELAAKVRERYTRMDGELARFIAPELPLELLDRHIAGREDNAHRLWGLYAMAVWIGLQEERASTGTNLRGGR